MANYLSTEELVRQLNQQQANSTETQKEFKPIQETKKRKFSINRKLIFLLALIAAIFHIFYVSIPLLSDNRGVNAFGVTTVLAVPMNQEIGQSVTARVILIEKLDIAQLKVGDMIIIYGEFGTDLNWVGEILELSFENQTAEVTFDGFIKRTIDFDEIEGLYLRNADLLGIISYISSNLRGYIFLLGTYVVGFSLVYYFYIRKKTDKPIQ